MSERELDCSPLDRSSRIQALVEDCLRRRAAGEVVSDQSLIDSHPELGQELKKLQLIGEAKMAADVDTDR